MLSQRTISVSPKSIGFLQEVEKWNFGLELGEAGVIIELKFSF